MMGRDKTYHDKRSQARFHSTYLDSRDFFCISCLRQIEDGKSIRHHVCPLSDGGLSAEWNVLTICETCHATIHNGNKNDAKIVNLRTHVWMAANYGFLFLLQSAVTRQIARNTLAEAKTLQEIRVLNESVKASFSSLFVASLPNSSVLADGCDLRKMVLSTVKGTSGFFDAN